MTNSVFSEIKPGKFDDRTDDEVDNDDAAAAAAAGEDDHG